MRLSAKEQQEIKALAQQFEQASGAQAVAAVVGKADDYPDIPWKAFALGVAKQFDQGMEAGVAAILGQLEGKGVAANLLADEQEKSTQQKSSGFSATQLKAIRTTAVRRIYFRHHRIIHCHRHFYAGHGLVSLPVPDTVLGDVSDYRGGRESHHDHSGYLRDRLSDRQAADLAQRLVQAAKPE